EVRWRRSCLSWALGDRCSLTRIMSPALPLFVRCCGGHRDLRSFPTRRSSDLVLDSGRGTARFHDRRDAVERFLLLLSIDSLRRRDRKSTRLNSSHVKISYAVFCLKKKK